MIDPKDSSKRPWVRPLFLRVVNKNVLFVKGDMDDVLILLKIICGKVEPCNRMFVEDTVLNDESSVMATII
jgi:hypothetical protein